MNSFRLVYVENYQCGSLAAIRWTDTYGCGSTFDEKGLVVEVESLQARLREVHRPIQTKLLLLCLLTLVSFRVFAQIPSRDTVIEIKTTVATVVVDQVILSTNWLPGCQPPICVTVKAPNRFLSVWLMPKDNADVGNINKETEKAYVVTQEGDKVKRWDFGFSIDREGHTGYILGFKVRSTGRIFTLSWPGGADYKLTVTSEK